MSLAVINLALTIGTIGPGLADVNGAFSQITHPLFGGFEARVHHQRIKPCLQAVPPLDRTLEPRFSPVALVQSSPHLGREITREGRDIVVADQILCQAGQLTQVGRDAKDALQPGRRCAEAAPLEAQGLELFPGCERCLARLLKGFPGQLRAACRLFGCLECGQLLVENTIYRPPRIEKLVRFAVDTFEARYQRAQAAACFDDQTPDVAIGMKQSLSAVA